MNDLTRVLSDEHKNILRVIKTLKRECGEIENGKAIDKDYFLAAIDFIRNYADKFHHAKEEDILFKALCGDSVEMHCNPTEQMLYEHNLGRDLVKNLETGVNEGDKQKVLDNARGYAYLLEDHISKEDNILYPMACEALPAETQNSIRQEFLSVEMEKFTPEVKEKYLKMVGDFEKRV